MANIGPPFRGRNAAAQQGAVDALLIAGFDRSHLSLLAGLLLCVRTPSAESERTAVEVLTSHGGEDVHVHDLPEEHYATTGGVSGELSFMKSLGM